MTDPRVRRATLVVVSSGNRGTMRGEIVRGAVGPVELPEPWWQETLPITKVLPGCHVLRLLDGEHDETGDMGGQVTYLVAHDGPIPEPLELRPWPGRLDDHPKRLPWARVGGPTADLEWLASTVTVDPKRTPLQHRTWNLSAIWSIPVVADRRSRGHDQVWLKCVPPFFAHERAVLEVLADQPIPQLIAADGHRLLLEPMPGVDGYGPDAVEELAMVDALVDLQLCSAERLEQLLAGGVPDLRSEALVAELSNLVGRLAPDDPLLTSFVESLPDRLALVDRLRLPNVLNHGDPHGGNCRRGTDPVLWFDWGDSFIGNPLLDVAAHHRLSDGAVTHWLKRWAIHVGADELLDVWPVLKPVSMLNMARVYQRFCDNIEPSELPYHRSDVESALDDVRRWLTASSTR